MKNENNDMPVFGEDLKSSTMDFYPVSPGAVKRARFVSSIIEKAEENDEEINKGRS